jgi:hypothetical protein
MPIIQVKSHKRKGRIVRSHSRKGSAASAVKQNSDFYWDGSGAAPRTKGKYTKADTKKIVEGVNYGRAMSGDTPAKSSIHALRFALKDSAPKGTFKSHNKEGYLKKTLKGSGQKKAKM